MTGKQLWQKLCSSAYAGWGVVPQYEDTYLHWTMINRGAGSFGVRVPVGNTIVLQVVAVQSQVKQHLNFNNGYSRKPKP